MSGFELKAAAGIVNDSKLTAAITPNPNPSNRARNAREVLSSRFDDLTLVCLRGSEELYTARDAYYRGDAVQLRVLPVTADRADLDLFRLEVVAAARLSHRNIIRCGPLQELNGIHFSTVEHRSDVETLKKILDRNGWLDLDSTIAITRQLTAALDHAHRNGVLHLRINPESILIAEDGTAILADFGIEGVSELAWAHACRTDCCPVHYISPEQASNGALDSRSDLYSLGVILYQMLTDRLPLDSEDPQAIRKKLLTQSPLPPHFYSSDVPDAMSSIVMCLLEKDPRARYQDAASLSAALNRLGNQTRVVEPPIKTHKVDPQRIEAQIETGRIEAQVDPQKVEAHIDAQKVGGQIEAQRTETAPLSDDFDEAPISIEELPAKPLLEAWEAPSIVVIDPPVANNPDLQAAPDRSNQIAYERVLEFQRLHPNNHFLSTEFGSPDTSTQQWRPVVLVAILAMVAIIGLIVLARFNTPNRTPAPATSTRGESLSDRESIASSTKEREEAAAAPASDRSVNANSAAGVNPAGVSSTPTPVNQQKTITKNASAQRPRTGKRKWHGPSIYFRESRQRR